MEESTPPDIATATAPLVADISGTLDRRDTFNPLPDDPRDLVLRLCSVDDEETLRLGPGEFQIPAAHPLVKGRGFFLETVSFFVLLPPEANRDGHIDKNRQVRLEPARRGVVDFFNGFQRNTAPVRLVSDRRIGETIADDELSLRRAPAGSPSRQAGRAWR